VEECGEVYKKSPLREASESNKRGSIERGTMKTIDIFLNLLDI